MPGRGTRGEDAREPWRELDDGDCLADRLSADWRGVTLGDPSVLQWRPWAIYQSTYLQDDKIEQLAKRDVLMAAMGERRAQHPIPMAWRRGLLCLMEPIHATIEEFAADGYTHVWCHSA
jgi:hypothetical protein